MLNLDPLRYGIAFGVGGGVLGAVLGFSSALSTVRPISYIGKPCRAMPLGTWWLAAGRFPGPHRRSPFRHSPVATAVARFKILPLATALEILYLGRC